MLKSKYEEIFQHQDDYWWYRGMADLNISLLKRYLPRNKNLKILDVGCGPGAALIYLSQFGDVIGVDKSEDALRLARKRGKVKKGDIANLPFKDGEFDVVVCLDVLYHKWVNTKEAISEINRVLRKEGILLMREPAFNWFRSSEDVASATRHRFTTDELRKELKNNFKILKMTYANFFLFPVAFFKRLPEVIGLKKKSQHGDASDISPFLNRSLYSIFSTEIGLINYINYPFGTSVICLAKKR